MGKKENVWLLVRFATMFKDLRPDNEPKIPTISGRRQIGVVNHSASSGREPHYFFSLASRAGRCIEHSSNAKLSYGAVGHHELELVGALGEKRVAVRVDLAGRRVHLFVFGAGGCVAPVCHCVDVHDCEWEMIFELDDAPL